MGTRGLLAILLVLLQYDGVIADDPCGLGCTPPVGTGICDALKGCSVGSPAVADTSDATCQKMTCKQPEFFISPEIEEEPGNIIDEIKCNDKKQWIADSKIINKATCIQKYSCTGKKIPLKTDCDGTPLTNANCDIIPFAADTDQTCSTGKFIFYQSAAGGDWVQPQPAGQINSLKCDPMGVWMAGTEALKKNDHVICAKNKPVKECTALPSSCSQANIKNTNAQCDENIEKHLDGSAEVKCVPGPTIRNLYTFDGMQYVSAAQIKCVNGEWKQGANPLTLMTNFICAAQDPNLVKCPSVASSCDAGNVNSHAGCDPISLKDDDKTPLACPGVKKLFFKIKTKTSFTQDDKIKCDTSDGKWKHGTTWVEITDPDNIVCATRDPTPVSCTPKPISNCDQVKIDDSTADCKEVDFDDSPQTCTDPNSPKLMFKKGGALPWVDVSSAKMECKSGATTTAWTLDNTGAPVDLTQTDEVICAKTTPTVPCKALPSECTGVNPAVGCEVITLPQTDGNPVDCLTIGTDKEIYYYSTLSSLWLSAPGKIKCDTSIAQWQLLLLSDWGDVDSNDNIVCATKGVSICQFNNALSSPFHAYVDCDEVKFDSQSDASYDLACADTDYNLYVKKSDGVWEKSIRIACDSSKQHWQIQMDSMVDMTETEVVCAKSNPVLKATCTAATNNCQVIPTVACDPPADLTTMPICAPGKGDLYFIVDDKHKFMKAESVECLADDKWKITYKFRDELIEEVLDPNVNFANLVCAASNPDPKVCKHSQMAPPPEYEVHNPASPFDYVAAGAVAACDFEDKLYNLVVSSSTDDLPLESDEYPVCFRDGLWHKNKDEKYADGDTVACIYPKCKTCGPIPPVINIIPNQIDPSDPNVDHIDFHKGTDVKLQSGRCNSLSCESGPPEYVIKDVSGEYLYFTGKPTCDANAKWVFGENKYISKIGCSQKMKCLTPNYKQVELTRCTDFAAFGCEEAVTDTTGDVETLKCSTTSKKMLFKKKKVPGQPDDKDFWIELKSNSLTCDDGFWEAESSKGKKYRFDYDYSVICADLNPKPEPTTTTTTTTTEAPKPICEYCKTLPKFDDCDSCLTDGNSTVNLEPKNDKCELRLAVKDYILLVSQTVQNKLYCKRDGVWMTDPGNKEVKVLTVRQELKKESWKVASYCVVGGVFLAIGGMAIGCIVIYMRMRKKPSQRENKKKERGVTKKYTASASNVQKGGRSTGGTSEAGQSKERAVSSKMEENLEDAPTLKI